MASTSFGKCSGARVVLLVAVLAGVFAPGTQAQLGTQLLVENELLDNDVRYTLSDPVIPGEGLSFIVPAGESVNGTIEVSNSATPEITFDVLDEPPLGGGRYSTPADALTGVVSLTGLRVVIVRGCGANPSNPGLLIKSYSMPHVPTLLDKFPIFSKCLDRQYNRIWSSVSGERSMVACFGK